MRRLLSSLGYGAAGVLLFLAFCVFAYLVLQLQVEVWELLGL